MTCQSARSAGNKKSDLRMMRPRISKGVSTFGALAGRNSDGKECSKACERYGAGHH
jgi:hypothetical protein